MAEIFAATKERKVHIYFAKPNRVTVNIGGVIRSLHIGDAMEFDAMFSVKVPVSVETYALVEAAEALEGKY